MGAPPRGRTTAETSQAQTPGQSLPDEGQGADQGCHWRDTSARSTIEGSTKSRRLRLMSSATEIRPFQIDMPEAAIADLRRRIDAMRWPGKELVADRSQGVQL